jgi:hypothetical protein
VGATGLVVAGGQFEEVNQAPTGIELHGHLMAQGLVPGSAVDFDVSGDGQVTLRRAGRQSRRRQSRFAKLRGRLLPRGYTMATSIRLDRALERRLERLALRTAAARTQRSERGDHHAPRRRLKSVSHKV